LEHRSHCEEQGDEANKKVKIRLLRLWLAMTNQTEGEGDTGDGVDKKLSERERCGK